MRKKQRRKVKRALATSGSSPAERIAWLLTEIWAGNRSAMARAIGCSPSVLAKIVRGEQNPGRRLLEAVASHPKVSPSWVLSGDGGPLLEARGDEPSGGWPVRIATQLLPGPADEQRTMLTDATFPVAAAFFQASRYWYRINGAEPVVSARARHLTAGDLLLMETNPATWRRPAQVHGRLCAVELPEAAGLQLVGADWCPGDGEVSPESLTVDTFALRDGIEELIEEIRIRRLRSGNIEARRVFLPHQVKSRGARNSKAAFPTAFEAAFHPITLQEIVGVCVLMVRPMVTT